jgi:hypothetical protein
MSQDPAEQDARIRNRESWLKTFVIGALAILGVWYLARLALSSEVVQFSFSEMLALILALFSVALSVLFYFKATDTSNIFYDNTYRFTREVSEILGRIEAGFGERLRHLDEGYAGLRDRFERMPFDRAKASEEIKHEEAQVQVKERERDGLLEDLAKRARLQEDEKRALLDQIKDREQELIVARQELSRLRARSRRAERTALQGDKSSMMASYVRGRVLRDMGLPPIHSVPLDVVKRRWKAVAQRLNPGFMQDMRDAGFVSPSGALTDEGLAFIQQAV